MSKADDIFYREFAVIILLLFLFTVCMIFVSRAIGAAAFEEMRNNESAVLARIQPVGEVRVGDPDQIVAAESGSAQPTQVAAAETAASSGAKSGEEVYNTVCMACHMTGAAGAPKLDDKAAWESRMGQGLDGLVSSAVNGKNAMPPKGGNPSLSEEEVRNAVEHMLDKAGVSG